MPVGLGEPMEGPVGRASRSSTRWHREQRRPGPPKAPALVALEDLSRRPVPPSLEEALAQLPTRRAHFTWAVTLNCEPRFRPDGGIARIRVVRESRAQASGEARRRATSGSRWSPPLDWSGQAVSTEIRYTCNSPSRRGRLRRVQVFSLPQHSSIPMQPRRAPAHILWAHSKAAPA